MKLRFNFQSFLFLSIVATQNFAVAEPLDDKPGKEYDFIVIGAGSAGSIVAGELAKTGNNVLVIEAGGDNLDPYIEDINQNNYFNIAFNTFNFGFLQWGYSTTEQFMAGAGNATTQSSGKILTIPRGKTLGGTHSINAAAYVQANAEDFNQIAEVLDDKSWEWYKTGNFRSKLESKLGIVELGLDQVGATKYINAAKEALNVPFNSDPTNGNQYGISPSFWTARQTDDGPKRSTTFDAFVLPRMDVRANKPRIDVVTFHHVKQLIFDPNDPTRIIGVTCVNTRAMGIETYFYASKEIIVSAGTYNSPLLLMRSGIGPRAHLEDMGIEVKADLPGVGSNLRDHYAVASFWNLVDQPFDAPFLFQSPILNIFGPEPTGQTKFQLEVSGNFGSCVPLRQESQGTIRLQSNSYDDQPVIDPNILSTENDVNDLVECLRDFLLPFWKNVMDQNLVSPGNLNPDATDDELKEFVLENIASNHHPVGTCKVGTDDDDMAVLDKDFKVRGFSNLRVIDASVFPHVPSGNINAPTMTAAMIGVKKIKKDDGSDSDSDDSRRNLRSHQKEDN